MHARSMHLLRYYSQAFSRVLEAMTDFTLLHSLVRIHIRLLPGMQEGITFSSAEEESLSIPG